MNFEWKLDSDGDWRLYVDGAYFGMVCPHEEWFVSPVATWGNNQNEVAPTVDEAKCILMNRARQEGYEEEFDSRPYPLCCG